MKKFKFDYSVLFFIIPLFLIVVFSAVQLKISTCDDYTPYTSTVPLIITDLGEIVDTGSIDLTNQGKLKIILSEGTTENYLSFKSYLLNFKIYTEDRILEEHTYDTTKPFFVDSMSVYYANISLKDINVQKPIYIEYSTCYKKGSLERVCLGNSTYLAQNTFQMQLPIMCCLLFFFYASLLCLIFYSLVFTHLHKFKFFLYLGLMIFFISAFMFEEAYIIPLFWSHLTVLSFLCYISLFFVPILLILYADNFYNIHSTLNTGLKTILYIYSFLSLIVIFVSNYLGILTFHNSIIFVHISLLLSIFYAFYCLFSYVLSHFTLDANTIKNPLKILLHSNSTYVLQGVGLIALCVSISFDLIRFYLLSSSLTIKYTGIGLFLLIFTNLYGSLLHFKETYSYLEQSKFVSNLAYKDGLTGLNNRTAYKEKLSNSVGVSFGIIMFDVNNLKHINDTYGHQAGDTLILKAAEVLKELFESLNKNAELYRIGGDEFVALLFLNEESVFLNFCLWFEEALVSKCKEKSDEINHILVSIAYGYSFYDTNNVTATTENMQNAIHKADESMYVCKKMMKAAMKREQDTEELAETTK